MNINFAGLITFAQTDKKTDSVKTEMVDPLSGIKSEDVKSFLRDSIVLKVGCFEAFVNGNKIPIDQQNDRVSIIKNFNGIVLVPVRFLSVNLGVKVTWQAETSTVVITGKDKTINLQVGSNKALVNGEAIELSLPVQMQEGRVYVAALELMKMLEKSIFTDKNSLIIVSEKSIDFSKYQDKNILGKITALFGVFVSPNAGEYGRGTIESPVQTIESAKATVRSIKNTIGIPNGGLSVFFRQGKYKINTSILFDENDSGTENAQINYRAYPGEEVNFVGGASFNGTDFSPLSDKSSMKKIPENARNSIVQLDLSQMKIKANDSTQLYYNGRVMDIARWPNGEYAKTGRIVEASGTKSTPFKFVVDDDRIKSWKNAQNAWVFGFWTWDWYDQRVKIQEIDTANKTIKTVEGHPYKVASNRNWYIYNLIEELDAPGEYFIDTQSNMLYLYPLDSDFDNSSIEMVTLNDTMVVMNGVSNVSFKGIIFEATGGKVFELTKCNNNSIEGCTIRNAGGEAVIITKGLKNRVLSCEIYNMAKRVIVLANGDRNTLTHGENIVSNNRIYRYALVAKTNNPAISMNQLGGTVGDIVSHNEIFDAPHQAIMFGGNENIMEYNEIYDVCKEASDASAIYSGRDWTHYGNKIRYNYFHDIWGKDGKGSHCIYFDDFSSGIEVYGNVVYNSSDMAFNHGGRDNQFYNNIIINCNLGAALTECKYTDVYNLNDGYLVTNLKKVPYKDEPWKSKYPQLLNVTEEDPFLPIRSTFINNLTVNAKKLYSTRSGMEKVYTIKDNLELKEDPGFEDMSNNKFQLKPDSMVYSKIPDFKEVPFNKMGLYVDEYRTSLPTMQSFNLERPGNKERDIVARQVKFDWQPSIGVNSYRFILAKDRNFSQIVIDKNVEGNSTTVDDLDYKLQRYYWKVEALSKNSKSIGKDVSLFSNYFSFTTAKDEILDKTLAQKELENLKAFYSTMTEGTEPGLFKTGSKQSFGEAINAFEALISSVEISQSKLDKATKEFQDKVVLLKRNKNIEVVTINDWIVREVTSTADADWSFEPNIVQFGKQGILFTPPAKGGKNTGGYAKQKIENNQILKFNTIMNLETGWKAFAFRGATSDTIAWSGNPSYLIIIKKDTIEIQRFSKKNLTKSIPNTFIKSGKKHLIEIGAIDAPTGVNLIMKVDGVEAVNYLDEDEERLRDEGHFQVYSYGDEGIRIMPVE
jgi:hypothetical protein